MVSFTTYASEFTHIKLNPEFESYLTQTESKSNLSKSFSTKSNNLGPNIQTKIAGALLGSVLGVKSGITNPIPVDGEESLLYEEIRRQLETAHEGIALDQVRNINRLNQQFNLGSSNYSGFSWQKPFGVVGVQVDRQVNPNIFGQNWLIMDTFTFEIEATTFLEKLAKEGMSTMSSVEIGAFAGISFRRVYTTWHYANSYQEGLLADFSKLFLPFMKFNQKGMERMAHEEIIKREDTWTASAGGLISTPPIYGFSFSGGVLAQYDLQNFTTVQSSYNPEERFKVGVSSKKSISAGVTLELQLDFYKLLKFSLLRYDMNYEYASGKELTLGFTANQWEQLKSTSTENKELNSILNGFGSVKHLEHYVVRLDESESSSFEQRGSVLIWGRLQKTKTEQVRVIKDEAVRVFYKNYSQNIKVVQNFLSRLFSAVVYKLLKLPAGVKNAAIYSQQITMEYEATHPQATDPNINRIDSTEQFSFNLTQYYNAARTDRWIDRRFKNDVIWFVDNFTTLPKGYKSDIRNELLKGPMLIESTLRVETAGMQYLLKTPESVVSKQLTKVCNVKNTKASRKKCLEDMTGKFQSFRSDYMANHLKPSLVKFKSFLTKYYKLSENISDLQILFGEENTFINGRLQAKTSLGNDFNTAFSSGQFRGLGVIDNFKRSTGSRTPASILSE
jgi:hypothetical protein